MIKLLCPVCKNILKKGEKNYYCSNGHTFDISKEGYSNFLLANKKNSNIPGDNKEMVAARDIFLNKGYYLNLVNEITNLINKYKINKINMLDAGCGTGYYSIQILKNRNLSDSLVGVDISKFAAQKAAKKDKNSTFLVASSFDLPIEDKSVDVLLNIFSPKANKEFCRVLKDDGILVEVMPGEEHMLELKRAMYDSVRLNDVNFNYDGFLNKEVSHLKYKIQLDNKEDIHSHVQMTPYYYKTPLEDLKKLDQIDKIEITIDFYIIIWSKQ